MLKQFCVFPQVSLLPSLLPQWFPTDDGTGKLYMANLATPKGVFRQLNIKYDTPFGAKMVAALHRN